MDRAVSAKNRFNRVTKPEWTGRFGLGLFFFFVTKLIKISPLRKPCHTYVIVMIVLVWFVNFNFSLFVIHLILMHLNSFELYFVSYYSLCFVVKLMFMWFFNVFELVYNLLLCVFLMFFNL